MKNHKTMFSQGFTLVELAVVLTIVALLIGGVLKGQEMIEDARVVATVAQVHGFESATMTFKKTYGDMPGDMPNAEDRLKNCGDCNPQDPDYAGDGWIGDSTVRFSVGTMGTNTNMAKTWQGFTDGNGVNSETRLFWAHLYSAGMINDVTTSDSNADPEFGVSLPAAKIGGGFLAGSISDRQNSNGRMDGVLLALVATPETVSTGSVDEFLLTPLRAAQIDRKMDDGFPESGRVQDASGFRARLASLDLPGMGPVMLAMNRNAGGGWSSPCRDLTSAMVSAGLTQDGYLEGVETGRVCNLAFKIAG